MDGALLPFDILADVMAICPPSSVLSLMATCKDLQKEGPRNLLRSGVILRNARDVMSFVRFLFSQNPVYLALLRTLDVRVGGSLGSSCDPCCSSWDDSLVNVLDHPSISLENLTINDSENLLAGSGPVAVSLGKLTLVKQLTLRRGGERARYMLARLPSRLTSADVTLCSDHLPAQLPQSILQEICLDWNPVFLLRNSCETLEELCWAQQDPRLCPMVQDIPDDAHVPEYPSMRSFSLRYGAKCWDLYDQVPRLAQFARAYPNLSAFSLARVCHMRAYLRRPPQNAQEVMRALNRIRQENAAALLDLGLEHEPWPALAECAGDLHSLYSMGLTRTRPVERLHVRNYANTMQHASMLCTVVADLRPSCLAVCAKGLGAVWREDGESLISALSTMKTCTVLTLDVDVALLPEDLRCDGSPQELVDALEGVRKSITRLPTTITSLTLSLELAHSTCRGGDDCSKRIEAFQEELNVSAECIRLLSPSLRSVDLSIAKAAGCESRF